METKGRHILNVSYRDNGPTMVHKTNLSIKDIRLHYMLILSLFSYNSCQVLFSFWPLFEVCLNSPWKKHTGLLLYNTWYISIREAIFGNKCSVNIQILHRTAVTEVGWTFVWLNVRTYISARMMHMYPSNIWVSDMGKMQIHIRFVAR